MEVCQSFMRLAIDINDSLTLSKHVTTCVTMDTRNAWVSPCSIIDILKNKKNMLSFFDSRGIGVIANTF